MSEHEHARRKLVALMAGTLSRSEEETVRAHLAQCPPCVREWESWKRLVAGLGRVPETRPTPARLARITTLAQARRREVMERRWNRTVLVSLAVFGWLFSLVSLTVGRFLVEGLVHAGPEKSPVPWELLLPVLSGIGSFWVQVWVTTAMVLATLPLLRRRRRILHGRLP